MKKLILTLLLLTGITATYAQKTVPVLKEGTNLFTTVYMGGQEIPVLMTITKPDGLVGIKWSVDGYGDGTFQMTEKGLESGSSMFAGQPSTGETKLSDSETFGMISRGAFKSLVDTKSFTYNGIKFTQKDGTPALKISGKEVDAYHVTSPDGKAAMWILNHPKLPLVIQTTGTAMDSTISEIK